MKTLLVLVTLSLFSTLSFAVGMDESEAEAMARVGINKYTSPKDALICASDLANDPIAKQLAKKAKGTSAFSE